MLVWIVYVLFVVGNIVIVMVGIFDMWVVEEVVVIVEFFGN